MVASANLGFLFRYHEDFLPFFTPLLWILRDTSLRRTGERSATGNVGQHQGNDVAGRIQGCGIE